MEKFEQELYDNLVDKSLTEPEMLETIQKTLGEKFKVRQFDSWIDDGGDGEDDYVMGAGFTVTSENKEVTDIIIYYGNNTGIIGNVTLRDC